MRKVQIVWRTCFLTVLITVLLLCMMLTCDDSQTTKSITIGYMNPKSARFGNQLFQLASLIGLSHSNQLPAVLPCDHYLRDYFEIKLPCARKSCLIDLSSTFAYEDGGGIYTKSLTTVGPENDVVLKGYLQSWRYFNNTSHLVRDQLKFKPHILSAAKETIEDVERRFSLTNKDYTRIGVHIRRGDIVNSFMLRWKGYHAAGKDYLDKSMARMMSIYKDRKVLFVVCSNGLDWAKENVVGDNVAYIETNSAVVDLAVLSLSDAVIMTTGSFGWWAAWLAKGPTIYYKDYPSPNSRLSREFNKEDFFFPTWIPM